MRSFPVPFLTVTYVTYEEVEKLKDEIGACAYFECSAKDNEGVTELFETAALLALVRIFL